MIATCTPQNTHDQNLQALESVAQISAAVGATSVDEVLALAARKMRELAGVARCSIYLRESEGGLFRGRVSDGCDRELAPYVKRSLAGMPADGMTCELLETRRPVIIADAQNDPRMVRSNARFWKIRSMMAVPMSCGGEIGGVVYLDDVERPHRFTESDAERVMALARVAAAAVSHAQVRADLAERLESSEARVRALRRVNAFDERLSEMVLAGAGLEALLTAIAQLHRKPCAVYDAKLRRLAVARPDGDEQGLVPRLLEEPHAHSRAVTDALLGGTDARAFVVPAMPDVGLARRHLVAPVVVDGELWGYLVMMEHHSRFNGADMLTLRRAAIQIALHASTERRAIEADWNGGASLAAELLTSGSDSETVAQRAARLGVRLEALHAVAVFASRAGRQITDFRAVAAAFGELEPSLHVQTTTLGESVGALVAMPAELDPDEFVRQLKACAGMVCMRLGEDLIAGISSPRESPEQYPDAHGEAREIVDCIRRFGTQDGQPVFTARELGLGRVFLARADADAVRSFAEAAFGQLVRDESKRDLLATLSCFFENMASVRRCALRLAVHENTIRYRLARLEELTGLAITHDPDAQLAARLSMLVLALSGALDPNDLLRRNQREAAAGLKVVGATR